VDVRVIAASNRDLRADVAAGRFRADLLWRLDVLRIRLPSLAQRREDVPALAEHLLRVIDERIGASHELSPETQSVLAARSWPGNARELRNSLEHAIAMSGDEPVIAPRHLPAQESSEVVYTVPTTWARFRAREERAFLLEALVAHGWNRTRAARTLGMSRQALHERIRKLGLRPVLVPPVDAVHEAGVGELARVAVSAVGSPAGPA
jgi:two-component system response regulator AtoC